MAFHREKWQSPLEKGSSPGWTCPTCRNATLNAQWKGVEPQETRGSRDAAGHEDWEPDWETKRFTLLLRCTAPECDEVVVMAGTTALVLGRDDDYPGETYEEVYRPEYVEPSPEMVEIPREMSDDLRDVLRQAFRLYWVDPAACVARLRAFTEDLMTALGIPAATRVLPKGGAKGSARLQRLTLDARLKKFAVEEPDLAEQLMAVKWLGNAGAHDGRGATQSDALDAMEILEHVLSRVYATKGAAHIAREVNKKKGPLSKKRRTSRKSRPRLRNPGVR